MSTQAAPATVHLPAPAEVREVVGGLVGRDVELRRGVALVPSSRSVCTLGAYADPAGRVRALVLLDRPLTVHLGSALGMVSPRDSEDELTRVLEGVPVEEETAENVEEVLNVLASAFNASPGVHVKLDAFHVAGENLPEDLRMMCYSLGRRDDHVLSVEGYGEGRLALVLAP